MIGFKALKYFEIKFGSVSVAAHSSKKSERHIQSERQDSLERAEDLELGNLNSNLSSIA